MNQLIIMQKSSQSIYFDLINLEILISISQYWLSIWRSRDGIILARHDKAIHVLIWTIRYRDWRTISKYWTMRWKALDSLKLIFDDRIFGKLVNRKQEWSMIMFKTPIIDQTCCRESSKDVPLFCLDNS